EFMDVEFEAKRSKSINADSEDETMPTLVKTSETNAEIDDIPVIDDADPFMKPINEQMRLRTEERKKKLKEYNHKFNLNKNKIDELENVPAYKRSGIELNPTDTSVKKSSTSVLLDDDNEIKLKTNNSFLHDNVD
ncbi:MAG: cell division protein FtsZ, partial [Flavobacteriaceae bacterium]|nr:cell division protein FtsZ [Flavobacteriaceae bacterium]